MSFAPPRLAAALDSREAPDTRGGDPLVAWATNQFIGNATGGTPPYSYEWNFGDGASSTDQNPNHRYRASGAYIVVLTVTDAAGNVSTSTFLHVVIFEIFPAVTIEATPTIGPAPLDVTFRVWENLAGTWLYAWDFGDGNRSGVRAPRQTYVRPGTYTVLLNLTTPEMGPEPYQITIVAVGSAPPKALANYSGEVSGTCEPFTQDVSFHSAVAGGTGPYAYLWDFGDGNTSLDGNPIHTYSWHTDALAVRLIVTDANGVVATSSTSYWVSPPLGCPVPIARIPLVTIAIAIGAVVGVGAAIFEFRRRKRRDAR